MAIVKRTREYDVRQESTQMGEATGTVNEREDMLCRL